jgi:hypothetical protein
MKFWNPKYSFIILVFCFFSITCYGKNEKTKQSNISNNNQFLNEKASGNDSINLENKKSFIRKIENTYEKSLLDNILSNTNESENINFYTKLKRILTLYLHFFIIFSVISFLRWHEELYKIKKLFVQNKYSMFLDLTSVENKSKPISELEEKYIFTSGKPIVKVPAQDILFNFSYNNNKSYAKIEREVEIFHSSWKKQWTKLGHIKRKEEISTYSDSSVILWDVNFLDDNYMQISYEGDIYTFPRVISSMFLGQVKFKNKVR